MADQFCVGEGCQPTVVDEGSKKFCVITPGRCGSTSLMQALKLHVDITTPGDVIKRHHVHELLHQDKIEENCEIYTGRMGRTVSTPLELIEAFFEENAVSRFVGFKHMPHFRVDMDTLLQLPGIQWIGLTRNDIPSQVASFQLALQSKAWTRQDKAHFRTWSYTHNMRFRIVACARQIMAENALIRSIPGSIQIVYEDLAKHGFNCEPLNAYFGRGIALEKPRGVTTAADYVANWDIFKAVVEEGMESDVNPVKAS